MSFEQDPNEQADISGADLAMLVDEMRTLQEQLDRLAEALLDAVNQVEYLHRKFGETGSGNGFLAQWRHLLTETEKGTPP